MMSRIAAVLAAPALVLVAPAVAHADPYIFNGPPSMFDPAMCPVYAKQVAAVRAAKPNATPEEMARAHVIALRDSGAYKYTPPLKVQQTMDNDQRFYLEDLRACHLV